MHDKRWQCTAVRRCSFWVLSWGCALLVTPSLWADETDATVARELLNKYCVDCHNQDSDESEVRLDSLELIDPVERQTVFAKAQEVVRLKQMPPSEANQPSKPERKLLLSWLSNQLTGEEARKLAEKLRRPEAGNYINHQDLFSGEFADLPGYSPDRRWLISEFIFDAKINDLINHVGVRKIDGERRPVVGDNGVGLGTRFGGQSLRQRITNPFLLPSTIGVRYYSEDALTGGHLLTMLSNAKRIAAHMTSESTMRDHYPAMHRIMRQEFEHRQTLRARQQFLNDHIERLLRDVFKGEHESLLPNFTRIPVPDPPEHVDRQGNPAKKKDNLGLLARYDKEDLDAIYYGMSQYDNEERPFDEVIEMCERDWFYLGVHEKRIRDRIAIMKVLNGHWDMDLIRQDVRKKRVRPPVYRPLDEAEMTVITETLRRCRAKNDQFEPIIEKCMAEWQSALRAERESTGQLNQTAYQELIQELYRKILRRDPSRAEVTNQVELLKSLFEKLETQKAIAKLAESLILRSEFVYRAEFGQSQPDELGRKWMSPRDLSYAIAYALTDSAPDDALTQAVAEDRLNTRDDIRREVERMLQRRDIFYVIDERVQKGNFNASVTNQPIRKLRFFREFFGYPKAMDVFKDDIRFGAGRHEQMVSRLIDEADLLVSHILARDTDVFETLLTTEEFFVFHSGDNDAMTAAAERQKEIYDYFRKFDWQNFSEEQLYEHWPFIDRMKIRGTVFANFLKDERRRNGWPRTFQTQMSSLQRSLGDGQQFPVPYDVVNMHYSHKGNATGRTGQVMRGHQVTTYFNLDWRTWDYPAVQPAKIPNRRGMLTHPAWLIAHSLNTETDPVRRGKWIREKLLAGTIPDVPITVDAVIPEDHTKTLRQRLEQRTGESYCWNCHQRMDPLGLPFESFDDFGRFRTEERIEHEANLITDQKQAPIVEGVQLAVYETLPVDSRGVLEGTGEPSLDGPVANAFELTDRLAQSTRVRQSIIRHAFRYFMGRNEMLSDSKTLMDAEAAYLESNGSFDAVIISLLTSDSFIFRKPSEQ